ncbi:MAG: signal peptidase II [Clostridia bacterium]|nr:signal peptidase II [Clostridia bacterium]
MIVWIIVIVAVAALDQLTKILIINSYALGESHEIIPGLFNFHYIQNKGAAWGMLSDSRWVFIVITAILLVVLPVLLYKFRKVHVMFSLSLSLVIGGALGNMIDRVFLGYVTDFIEAAFINFPVFNFADSCVTVGAVMMAVYLIFIDKTLFSDKKNKTGEEQNDDKSDE